MKMTPNPKNKLIKNNFLTYKKWKNTHNVDKIYWS